MREIRAQRLKDTFGGKNVFVTGHTGFKGAWLAEWLLLLNARVIGFSLPPPTTPALFDQLDLASRTEHHIGDIRDVDHLGRVLQASAPVFVFHLAAQPLVRRSYQEPLETYSTNVLGTANVLEAIRRTKRPCTVIAATTDKCYENHDSVYGYREDDRLGGFDPYSSSKAAAELVIAAYRNSFFSRERQVRLASVRAGNVVGGGDWALDRIVPDSIRALREGESIRVRNPRATRPWQHVLEPLSGYLALAAEIGEPSLPRDPATLDALCSAFNFGPSLDSNRTVADLVDELLKHVSGTWSDQSNVSAPHEAQRLHLAIDKAFHYLRWKPVWSFERTIAETTEWYSRADTQGIAQFTRNQITQYIEDASLSAVPWSQ